jgi:dihydropteroate synthase
MLGRITGRAVHERVHASIAAALLAALRGASIVRAHDVQATCDALAVLAAVEAVGAH